MVQEQFTIFVERYNNSGVLVSGYINHHDWSLVSEINKDCLYLEFSIPEVIRTEFDHQFSTVKSIKIEKF